MSNIVTHNIAYKYVLVEDINGTTGTDSEVDLLGYDYVTIVVATGVIGATAASALSFHCSDTSGFTPDSSNDIFTASGTTGASRLPQPTDDKAIFIYHWDRRASASGISPGRYFQTIATGAAVATPIAIILLCSRAGQVPNTQAESVGSSTLGGVNYLN